MRSHADLLEHDHIARGLNDKTAGIMKETGTSTDPCPESMRSWRGSPLLILSNKLDRNNGHPVCREADWATVFATDHGSRRHRGQQALFLPGRLDHWGLFQCQSSLAPECAGFLQTSPPSLSSTFGCSLHRGRVKHISIVIWKWLSIPGLASTNSRHRGAQAELIAT